MLMASTHSVHQHVERRTDFSSTHFHRRLSATEPVDGASAMRPLSDVGEPAVGLYLHGAHLVRSRRIRHFMPTTGVPAPQDPHKTADRRHSGGDHRRPHQYLSQPHAPLNSDDPLLRVPKSGQLVHAHRDAHDRLGENALHGDNAGDGLFDHAPAKTTQPSRCATPIDPRPRTRWRNVPAWCGGHGFGHGTRWNRRELAGRGETAGTAERR